jgi:hypothetical protein
MCTTHRRTADHACAPWIDLRQPSARPRKLSTVWPRMEACPHCAHPNRLVRRRCERARHWALSELGLALQGRLPLALPGDPALHRRRLHVPLDGEEARLTYPSNRTGYTLAIAPVGMCRDGVTSIRACSRRAEVRSERSRVSVRPKRWQGVCYHPVGRLLGFRAERDATALPVVAARGAGKARFFLPGGADGRADGIRGFPYADVGEPRCPGLPPGGIVLNRVRPKGQSDARTRNTHVDVRGDGPGGADRCAGDG